MQKKFQAVLENHLGAEPSWAVVRVPFDPTEVWPNRLKLRVKGTLRAASHASGSEAAFCTSLFRKQDRGYFLLVTAKMRKAAGLALGSLAEIVLEPDLEGRAATPPPELAKLLKSDRAVRKWFEALPYSYRKFAADTISEPKSAEARTRRAEQWMERMMLTMEGEEFPPPILQIAFRRQPLAREGWDRMTANQRRMMLFSIYTCQSPEAQSKRVERAIEEALKRAGKTATAKTSRGIEAEDR